MQPSRAGDPPPGPEGSGQLPMSLTTATTGSPLVGVVAVAFTTPADRTCGMAGRRGSMSP
jgi:hypothetical protein